MKWQLYILAAVLVVGSASAAVQLLEVPSRIEPLIVNQTEIDQHIAWTFVEITETNWLMQGQMSTQLLVEAQAARTTRDWNELAVKYNLSNGDATRQQLSDFINYPFTTGPNVTIQRIEANRNTGYLEYSITFPEGMQPNLTWRIGWNSTLITTGSSVLNVANFWDRDQIFYSNLTGRVYYLVSAPSNIMIYSSLPDGSNMSSGGTVDTGSYQTANYEGALFENSTDTRLHVTYSVLSDQNALYRMINLTSTNPYVEIGNEETFYIAPSASDDVELPSVEIASDGCLISTFGLQNASKAAGDQFDVWLVKESAATGCGDGDWDTADTIIIGKVNDGAGYQNTLTPSLRIANNSNDTIVGYHNTDNANGMILGKYFNASTDTLGSEVTCRTTAALTSGTQPPRTWTIQNNKIVCYAANTTTSGFYAHVLDDYTDTTFTAYHMGFSPIVNSNPYQGIIAAVPALTTSQTLQNYVFGIDNTDDDDIIYTNSTAYTTWNTETIWLDEHNFNGTGRGLSVFYDAGNCRIPVLWQLNNATATYYYYEMFTDVANCDTTPPTCTQNSSVWCSGAWAIDCTVNPVISSTYDIADNAVTFNGSGIARVTGRIHNFLTAQAQNNCDVRGNVG